MCKFCKFDERMDEAGFKHGAWLNDGKNEEEFKVCLYEFDSAKSKFADDDEVESFKSYGIFYKLHLDYIDGPTVDETDVLPLHLKYCPMCGRKIDG